MSHKCLLVLLEVRCLSCCEPIPCCKLFSAAANLTMLLIIKYFVLRADLPEPNHLKTHPAKANLPAEFACTVSGRSRHGMVQAGPGFECATATSLGLLPDNCPVTWGHYGVRPPTQSLVGWRPFLLGWRPSLLGWRPSLLGLTLKAMDPPY